MPIKKRSKIATQKPSKAGTARSTLRRATTRSSKTQAKTAKLAKRTTATTRKTTAKQKKVKANISPIRAPFNRSAIKVHLAEHAGVNKNQVGLILEELANLMHRHLRSGSAGEFTLSGLLKCVVKHKPATKSRRGTNPFTGESMTFKAKPARNVIKVRALKRLKEMVK